MNEIPAFLLDALKAGGGITLIVTGLGWFFYKEIRALQKETIALIENHKNDYKNVVEEMIKAINELTNAVKDRK